MVASSRGVAVEPLKYGVVEPKNAMLKYFVLNDVSLISSLWLVMTTFSSTALDTCVATV